MIDESIILEISDLLTQLTYSLGQPGNNEHYEPFILLKNFYDSIGYYTYNDLEAKNVWSYSLMLILKLQEFTSLDDSILEDRVKEVIAKTQQYLDKVHGSKNLIVIPKWPEGFVEKDQLERDIKRLTWRFGCCLVICLRAGGSKNNPLIQFLLEFLNSLNRGLYSSQGITTIEDNLLQSEEKFNEISTELGNIGYPLDIIKKEYIFTIDEFKKIFKL